MSDAHVDIARLREGQAACSNLWQLAQLFDLPLALPLWTVNEAIEAALRERGAQPIELAGVVRLKPSHCMTFAVASLVLSSDDTAVLFEGCLRAAGVTSFSTTGRVCRIELNDHDKAVRALDDAGFCTSVV